MVPLVMSTFGKLGPAAEGYLQNVASVACSTGVVDRGVWSVLYTRPEFRVKKIFGGKFRAVTRKRAERAGFFLV
jgi:hypothetical protein